MSLMLLRSIQSNFLRSAVASPSLTIERCVHHHMERENHELFIGKKRSNPQRANRNTHINEKRFRAARGRKYVQIELPDYEERRRIEKGELSSVEFRTAMMRRGINPGRDISGRNWQEAQLTFQSFYGVADPQVLPESYALTDYEEAGVKGAAKEVKKRVTDRFKNVWSSYFNGVRRIRKKEGFKNFKSSTFALEAEQIYEEAFNALAARDVNQLHRYVTEYAYPKLWEDVERGTLVYKWVGVKEPSKVLSVRCADYPQDTGNDIAQVIVRMHIEQIFALYDRFGKLLLGNPTVPKAAVEYVVFENHIAATDSRWRFHDKLYPKWSQPKSGLHEVIGENEKPLQLESPPLPEEEEQRAQK